jgi:hypothetical protein
VRVEGEFEEKILTLAIQKNLYQDHGQRRFNSNLKKHMEILLFSKLMLYIIYIVKLTTQIKEKASVTI